MSLGAFLFKIRARMVRPPIMCLEFGARKKLKDS